VEKLFACPAPGCQIDVNADLNASVNLHRVLYGTFPRIKKDGDTIVVERARTTYDEVEREVLRRLRNDAAWLKCGGVQDIEGLDGDAEGVF
jgi:transposase